MRWCGRHERNRGLQMIWDMRERIDNMREMSSVRVELSYCTCERKLFGPNTVSCLPHWCQKREVDYHNLYSNQLWKLGQIDQAECRSIRRIPHFHYWIIDIAHRFYFHPHLHRPFDRKRHLYFWVWSQVITGTLSLASMSQNRMVAEM